MRWMTSSTIRAVALLAALAAPAVAQEPLLIGATVSETGMLADLAGEYRKGLLLWQEETNRSGGIKGRNVQLKLVDDASDAINVGKLYVELIRQSHADALLGPYGSAAALMASAEAESARRILVNGAAASHAVYKRLPRYVFQAGVPYGSYGEAPLQAAKALGARTVFIIARDDFAPREMAEAARVAALSAGLSTGEVEVHAAGEDFGLRIAKARAAGADAWIAFGEAGDAAEMVKSFKRFNFAPRLFYASGAADPAFIEYVGQDAEYTLASREYDTRLPTQGNEAFVKAFKARWSSTPGAPAAEGFSAATVLGEALRRAGTDAAKLREVLGSAEIPTVLGTYKADPKTGEQIGTRPALVQIVKGKPLLVAPTEGISAPVVVYPQWSERRYSRGRR